MLLNANVAYKGTIDKTDVAHYLPSLKFFIKSKSVNLSRVTIFFRFGNGCYMLSLS